MLGFVTGPAGPGTVDAAPGSPLSPFSPCTLIVMPEAGSVTTSSTIDLMLALVGDADFAKSLTPTDPFLICAEPTLFFGRTTAAVAVPPRATARATVAMHVAVLFHRLGVLLASVVHVCSDDDF